MAWCNLVMKRIPLLLVLSVVLGTAGAARADSLATPIAPQGASVSANPLAEPGFNSDVERGLSDLTRLQCSMLSVLLLNPRPCAMP